MNGTVIILKKELKRVFGDKKLVFSLFILPAIIMVALYGIMGFMMGKMNDDIEDHRNLVYVVNAPEGFKNTISAAGYDKNNDVVYFSEEEYKATVKLDEDMAKKEDTIKTEEDLLKYQVKNNEVQLIVYFETDFGKKYDSYTKSGDAIPSINVFYNPTENYSTNTYGVFTASIMNTYQAALLKNRLEKESIDMESLNVFNVVETTVAKEAKEKGKFISMMLPYMMVIMLFAGAMSVGVDAIAGEKERGTLASMLLSPVNRSQIVAGKIISLMILSGLSAIVYVVSMMVAMPVMKALGGESADMAAGLGNLELSLVQGLQLVAIMLTLVFLFVSLIAFLAVRAKDVKTASTYISPVYIVVMVAGMLTMFMSGDKVPTYRYAIPVYGGAIAVKDLCVNELTATNFLASLVGALVLALIFTVLITKSFNDERVMFNA